MRNNRALSPVLLSTDRLIIRTYLDMDAPDLNRFVLDNVPQLLDTGPLTLRSNQTITDSREFIRKRNRERQSGQWIWNAILRKVDLQFIGQLVITRLPGWKKRAEIGYFITHSEQRKGYATEAVKEVINYCYGDLQMSSLLLRIMPSNVPSLKVAQKLGFQAKEIKQNDFRNYHGKLKDCVYLEQSAPSNRRAFKSWRAMN